MGEDSEPWRRILISLVQRNKREREFQEVVEKSKNFKKRKSNFINLAVYQFRCRSFGSSSKIIRKKSEFEFRKSTRRRWDKFKICGKCFQRFGYWLGNTKGIKLFSSRCFLKGVLLLNLFLVNCSHDNKWWIDFQIYLLLILTDFLLPPNIYRKHIDKTSKSLGWRKKGLASGYS